MLEAQVHLVSLVVRGGRPPARRQRRCDRGARSRRGDRHDRIDRAVGDRRDRRRRRDRRKDHEQRGQRPRTLTGVRRRASRRDRGEVTVTTILMPVIVMATMFVVQVGLAYHTRQVVSGAVQDGAATGAMVGSQPEDGATTAQSLIDAAAGNLVTNSSTSATRTGDVVTVSASATVVRVFPLFPTFTVSADSSATVERFRPQGEP